MNITLMGMQVISDNKGCEALTYSFIYLLEKIASEQKLEICYSAIVFSEEKEVVLPVCTSPIKCVKISLKSLGFYKELKKTFKESDLIVDFTGGDSFSDIYGKKRFYMLTEIKKMAIQSKTPFMLGPQTYGPFYEKNVMAQAKKVIQKSSYVFARDPLSKELAEKISNRSVELTTDIAFALPYETKKELCNKLNKIRVGLNPSGLLWEGGYTKENQFGLTVDYREYCFEVLKRLSANPKYEIFLIPHVGTSKADGAENDYNVCALLKEKYPECILVEEIQNPIEAKNYISGMDVFVGARMHATIASFSSKVATIPFSYSRKFEGLYQNIDYQYIIHATTQSTEEAIDCTMTYIENYKEITEHVAASMEKVQTLISAFQNRLTEIVVGLAGE